MKHKYHLTNSFIFKWDWESDFFFMTKSGIMYEIEIKISKADFKKDFAKPKHRIFEYLKGPVKQMKDPRIDNMKLLPHKFFFCTPPGLIKFEELPSYAGLIEMSTGFGMNVLKEAPMLHKHKPNVDKLLLDKFYYRSMNQRQEIETLRKERRTEQNLCQPTKTT